MVWYTGLKHHEALKLSSSGAPGDLGEELKRTFGCPKVRHMQAHVTVYHAYESYVGKIMSLGDHLSAHEDVDLFLPDITQHLRIVLE
jgi:hypothetical protein